MSRIVNMGYKFFTDPKVRFSYLTALGLTKWMSDQKYISTEYKLVTGKTLRLDPPETFNEKLQWLKLHDRNPNYTKMVDKAAAKQYVADKIGEEYIIPTLGVWDHFAEIDFSRLPEQFVLKCTHDSGGSIICRDKSKFDKKEARNKLEKFLRRKYFYVHREWPYKNVKPRIMAEAYMQDGERRALTDYKFYCFNGKPTYLYVSTGLENHRTAKLSFLNIDWSFASFGRSDFSPMDQLPEKPKNYDKMLELAGTLSEEVTFLRVDLYEINGKIYFGELTFSPCAGMMPFSPPEADLEVGKQLDISSVGFGQTS